MGKGTRLKESLLIIVISAAVATGLNVLLLSLNLAQYSSRYQEAAELLWEPPIWQQILYNGMLIPIFEELIFRGILFRVLRKWMVFPWAMTVSALAFGVYHGNLVQFVYAGICGLLLAYWYEKRGNILAPILSHMTMNLVAIFLTECGAFSWMLQNC